MGYETEAWRQPTIGEDDTVICSEHGRSLNNTDFRSYWLVLVKAKFGGYWLLVKHGGGEERISLGYHYRATGLLAAMQALDSDNRYLLLYVLYETHSEATQKARQETAAKYQKAFLEGRMKRRKRDNRYYVEIQAAKAKEEIPS